jgi:hypothetical protein
VAAPLSEVDNELEQIPHGGPELTIRQQVNQKELNAEYRF